MLEEVFGHEYQEAKITIEIGDYKISMQGQLDPPAVKTDRFEEGIYTRRNFGNSNIYNDIEEILLKLKPTSKIEAVQWRWTIPVAIPPRIEE